MRYGIRRVLLPALGSILLAPACLFGVHTQSVEHDAFEDFIEGEFHNVSLSSRGVLELAPEAAHLASPDESIIWNAVAGDGGEIYYSTGEKGVIYRLAPDGEPEEIFAPDQVLARSLVLDDAGTLYVGTSPEGKVYRIRDGEDPEVFFDPEEHYIWDLRFDGEGTLYVATGADGRIYQLPADYEPGDDVEAFFESEQTHISALAWDGEGRLHAGTSPGGMVYRVNEDGRGFVVLNTGDQEIRHMETASDGSLYVATFTDGASGETASSRPTGAIANVISALIQREEPSGNDGDTGATPQPRGANREMGAIYRLAPDGFVEPYWTLPGFAIHSMILLDDDQLLVGTDRSGRIFSIGGKQDWKLWQKLDRGGEVSVLLAGRDPGDRLFALTSNPGHLYEMDFSAASEGRFTGEVVDADQTARWGRIHMDHAAEGVRIETRSGNTEEPGKTWSDWSAPEAGDAGGYAIDSPNARYIQYRIHFEGSPDDGDRPLARMSRVRLFYRNFNASPVISAVKLVPQEVALERVPPSPQPPSVDLDRLFDGNQNQASPGNRSRGQLRVEERPGLATIAWQASDPNDDMLSFTLRIRAEDETRWTTLAEDLRDTFYSFNTRGFEEGYYYAQVTASDHLSNPPDEARTDTKESDAFIIDNTPPLLELTEKIVANGRVMFRVTAEDEVALIRSVRYSVNGGESQPLFPEDELYDSRRETFRIELNDLEPGPHSMIVEAEDEAGNSRVLHIHFDVD